LPRITSAAIPKQENYLYRPAVAFCAAGVPGQRGFGRNRVEPDGHDTEFETNKIKTIAGNRRSCLGFFYRFDNFDSCIARSRNRFGTG